MKTPEMTGRCKEMKFIFEVAEGIGIENDYFCLLNFCLSVEYCPFPR